MSVKPTSGAAFLMPELNPAQIRLVNDWIDGVVADLESDFEARLQEFVETCHQFGVAPTVERLRTFRGGQLEIDHDHIQPS